MFNHTDKLPTDVYGVTVDTAKIARLFWSAEDAVAFDADGVMTSKAGKTSKQTVTDGLTSPAVPRALEVVVGGTGRDAKASSTVVIKGTNIEDKPISETFTLTGDKTETLVGTKAFKTVSSVEIDAQDGTGVTFTVGWTNKLGLPFAWSEKHIAFATLNGTRETTDPTLAVSSEAIEANTITLNSALDGHAVEVYFIV